MTATIYKAVCRRDRAGFTLVEVMIASALALLLVTTLLSSLVYQRQTFKVQQDLNEIHQNVRSSMELIARDLSMARYGLRVADQHLDDWIDWELGLTSNPMFVDGGTGPDEVVIAAAFGEPVANLSAAATNNTTVLHLGPGEGSLFTGRNRNVIFLGRTETVKIRSVMGDSLVITREPGAARGVKYSHPAGTEIELVQTVRYRVEHADHAWPSRDVVLREDSLQEASANWQQILAVDIEDLQVLQDGKSATLFLTGRAPEPDRFYTHPEKGDAFRRWTLERTVHIRNARLFP